MKIFTLSNSAAGVSMSKQFSTRDVAEMLRVPNWRIRRLYEDGTLPEPERLAGRRVIRGDQLPAVCEALWRRGWLPEREVQSCR